MSSFFRELLKAVEDGSNDKKLKPQLRQQLEELKTQCEQVDASQDSDADKLPPMIELFPPDSSDDEEADLQRRLRGLLTFDTGGLGLSEGGNSRKRVRKADNEKKREIGVGVLLGAIDLDDQRTVYETSTISAKYFGVIVKGENKEKRKLGLRTPKFRSLESVPWRFCWPRSSTD